MKELLRSVYGFVFATCLILHAQEGVSQTGSFKVTFTPTDGGAPVTMQFSQPLLKFDNPHGYWFVNPHTGDRHMQYKPDAGYGDRNADVAFITFNETANDFDFYDGGGNDSDEVAFRNKSCVISAPEYNSRASVNKPLHVHINSFTSPEISFTISGMARSALVKDEGNNWKLGTIEGSGHFYREPKYIQSDVLTGCNCDPVIYATVYDEENYIRTTSACENALYNKVFDAVQRSMAPLFTNVAYKGTGTMSAGNIDITMMAGHVDINVPVKERPWCFADYRHHWLTGIAAQKSVFTCDDKYGLRFIKMPEDEQINPASLDLKSTQQRQIAIMDSMSKLMAAKKITTEQYGKALEAFTKNFSAAVNPIDLKKLEAEDNLYLQVIINPYNNEAGLLKVTDKNKTVIEHNIKGAAYEIFSPEAKDGDGNWTSNRLMIYIGNFSPPVMGKSAGGYDAEIAKANYPPNGNKLSVYNIIIKMEGGKDLIEKAVANIDFGALQTLITKQ